MLRKNDEMLKMLPQLSKARFVCHCRADQTCHASSITTEYREMFPGAYNRDDTTAAAAPSAEALSRLASLREETDSDERSTADEGAPARGVGWVESGKQMQVGSGHTRREICDGQSLASPGRWQWNTELTRKTKRGDLWLVFTRTSHVLWARPHCSHLLPSEKSRNVGSARTASRLPSTPSYEDLPRQASV